MSTKIIPKIIPEIIHRVGLTLVAAALLHGCAHAPKPKPSLDDWMICRSYCDEHDSLTLGLFGDGEELSCACVGPAKPEKKPIEAYRVRPALLGPDPRHPKACARRTI